MTAPWAELIDLALKALKKGSIVALRALDSVFHQRFLHEGRAGNDSSRHEFALSMAEIVESAEAREKPRPSQVQQLLARWDHTAELIGAMKTDVDAVKRASELIRGRKHPCQIVVELAHRPQGIKAGMLAKQLGISAQHFSKIARELQHFDIIERRRAGKHVYVSLGLIGQQLVDEFDLLQLVDGAAVQQSEAAATGLPAAIGMKRAATFGDLRNSWFARDMSTQSAFDNFNLPHFVMPKT